MSGRQLEQCLVSARLAAKGHEEVRDPCWRYWELTWWWEACGLASIPGHGFLWSTMRHTVYAPGTQSFLILLEEIEGLKKPELQQLQMQAGRYQAA
jgi:hypothetical protein